MELFEAVNRIITNFGTDILYDRKFINILLDYYHFDVPAKKRIAASLIEDGQLKKLVNCRDIMLEINSISDFEYKNNGYHEDLTKDILLEFARGLGKSFNYQEKKEKAETENSSSPQVPEKTSIIDIIGIKELISRQGRLKKLKGSIIMTLISCYGEEKNGDDLFRKNEYDKAFDFYKSNSNKSITCEMRFALCLVFGIGTQVDYGRAKDIFMMYAKTDAFAMYCIGLIYDLRHSSESEYTEAVKWYMKSSDKNFSPAQTNIGVCYYKGKGVAIDYKEATKWFKKAAKQDNACGQAYLGICYLKGLGVRKNVSEAVQLFMKSSDQHHLLGMYYLGQCYENGIGIMQSKDEAIKLYKASAAQGYEEAKNRLALLT